MKRKAASRQLCNGHCRSLTLPVHNHRTGCKDRLKHNRLQYPQIGISRLLMVIRRGNSRLRRGIGSAKRPGKDVATTGCGNQGAMSAFCLPFRDGFQKGFRGAENMSDIFRNMSDIF